MEHPRTERHGEHQEADVEKGRCIACELEIAEDRANDLEADLEELKGHAREVLADLNQLHDAIGYFSTENLEGPLSVVTIEAIQEGARAVEAFIEATKRLDAPEWQYSPAIPTLLRGSMLTTDREPITLGEFPLLVAVEIDLLLDGRRVHYSGETNTLNVEAQPASPNEIQLAREMQAATRRDVLRRGAGPWST